MAITVTVQDVLYGRSEEGFNVKVLLGEAPCTNVCDEPEGHSMVKALGVAFTLSLKLTTIFELTATFVARSAGEVPVTVGAASPDMPFAVTEKSSIARPWSFPA